MCPVVMICMYNDKDYNNGDNDGKTWKQHHLIFILKKKMKLIEYTNLLRIVS